jgi:hypothetical protein
MANSELPTHANRQSQHMEQPSSVIGLSMVAADGVRPRGIRSTGYSGSSVTGFHES